MVRFWLQIYFILFVTLLAGCVVNPKYETADAQHQKEMLEQNSQHQMQIRNYQADQQKQTLYETLYKNNENQLPSYQIIAFRKEKWSVGDPNSFLHFGNQTYSYRHKINLLLTCNKNGFYLMRPRFKQINWRISELFSGTASVSPNGDVNIYFTDNQSVPYPTIEILTDKKNYRFPLNQNLTLELDKNEC